MKKINLFIVTMILMVALAPIGGNAYGATPVTALVTESKLDIDGKSIALKTYNISGHNYVKLIDMAWLLNKSPKQFDVAWDSEKKAINIKSSASYSGAKPLAENTLVGAKGELSSFALYKDNNRVKLTAYVIDGRTYFKLRELCMLMDISLVWDSANKLVVINSKKTFVEETGMSQLNFSSEYGEFQSGTVVNATLDSYKDQVISLVNKKRASLGLEKLSSSTKLEEIAQFRAQDMFEDNYFSHTSPTYGDFSSVAKDLGYTAVSMGENIAKGQSSPSEVVDDWMNSSGHRANILRDNYEDIGIGIVEYQPGRFIWVQLFSEPK